MIERHSHSGRWGDWEKISYNDLKDKPDIPTVPAAVYGIYTISSATLAWGSTNNILTLTESSTSWSDDFSLSSNVVTIKNAWLYIFSACVRYDNIASWTEELEFSYKSSWGTILLAEQTYFSSANDYITLSWVLDIDADDTVKLNIINKSTVSNVWLTPISKFKIVKL